MGEEIAVSVVIPVYNTGDYLADTLQCICNQTLRNIEIIVINDGSTDNSLHIAESFAAQDSRIAVYSQSNQGQSVARNNAMPYVRGSYIYYMDSDDIIDSDALRLCYEKCESQHLDFLFFDADILNSSVSYKLSLDYQRTQYVNHDEVLSGVEMLNLLIDHHGYSASPCLSFIKTDYIKEGNTKWYPGIIHEDELFTLLLYVNAKRVSCIPRTFYHRRLRDNSTMTRAYSWRNIIGYQTVTREALAFMRTTDAGKSRAVRRYLTIMMNAVVYCAWSLPLSKRIQLASYVLFRFPYSISLKYYITLLFKKCWAK